MIAPTVDPPTAIEVTYQKLRDIVHLELRLLGADQVGGGYADIMALIELLISQRHPNVERMRLVMSAAYQVLMGQLLSPLTGNDDEWEELTPVLSVNVRCPRVFKELGVGCYDTQAIVFVNENDEMFTKQPQSRRPVAFPYEPKTDYVKVRNGPQLIVPPHARKKH